MRFVDFCVLAVIAVACAGVGIARNFAPPEPPPAATPQPLVQELPEVLVNAPAVRQIGPDGEPLLDHAAGW